MNELSRWYGRPAAVLASLGIVVAFSAAAVLTVRLGPSKEPFGSLSVIVRHDGMSSREMERSITVPLEEGLSSVPGIGGLESRSEPGQSRIDLHLSTRGDAAEIAARTRAVVDRVSAVFPSSVQKPLIVSSSTDRRPVYILVFEPAAGTSGDPREIVERIRPGFARIEGTGEVEVLGGRQREIHVVVDMEKAAQFGVSLPELAAWIRGQSPPGAGGSLSAAGLETGVVFLGRIDDLELLASLEFPLPGGSGIRLDRLAAVRYGYREPLSISRIDGEERILLAVQSSGTANLIALSRKLRTETDRRRLGGLDSEVLLDTGREIERSVMRLLAAIGLGMTAISAFLTVFSRGSLRAILLSLSLPLATLVTFAVLAVLRINVDRRVLAGFAVGMGLIVDVGIVLNEGLIHPAGEIAEIRRLLAPLTASTLTTVAAVIPLFFVAASGIAEIALALVLLICSGYLVSVLFLSPLLYRLQPGRRISQLPSLLRRIRRRALRIFHRIIGAVMAHPLPVLAAFTAVVTLSGFALAYGKKDLQRELSSNSIYAHLELESGATVEEVDEKCRFLHSALRGVAGIERIETVARRDSAEMLFLLEPAAPRREVAEAVRIAGSRLPRCTLYLPEPSIRGEHRIEVLIQGDDDGQLKALARDAARTLEQQPWVKQTVLHFKTPAPAVKVRIVHERAAGITTADVTRTLRWSLQGPTAVKWIEEQGEIDLRVMADWRDEPTLSLLAAFPIPTTGGGFTELDRLARLEEDSDPPAVHRKNRQRAVSLSVHCDRLSLNAMSDRLSEVLGGIRLPRGYTIEQEDRGRRAQQRELAFAMAFAAFLVFAVLAAQAESFRSPVIIVVTVPVSLSVPVAALWVSGLAVTPAVLAGLIVLIGIAVNNAILVVDNTRRRLEGQGRMPANPRTVGHDRRRAVRFALRKRLRPLLLTSGTSIIGVLPLLGPLGGGSSMLSDLAFVVFWGVAGSLLSALLVLPAMVSAFPGLLPTGGSPAPQSPNGKHSGPQEV